ncbi:MAG: YcfL family protein [Kiritimatiellae bacterium]|nr:YcfL family protein [Kiritimatiellia bacterium]
MRMIVTLVMGGLVLSLMTGCSYVRVCASTSGMEIAQRENGVAVVAVDDGCFADWLSVKETSLRRSDAGFLTAGVSIRNMKTVEKDHGRMDDFQMQYHFSWFDANGIELHNDTSYWTRITLHGGETVQLRSTALNVAAVKYIVRMRHVR